MTEGFIASGSPSERERERGGERERQTERQREREYECFLMNRSSALVIVVCGVSNSCAPIVISQ